MKTITLRKLPPELAERIEREAAETGASLNKTVIRLLEQATGVGVAAGERVYHDLDHLAGSWSAEQAEEFERSLAEQRVIDPELWDDEGR